MILTISIEECAELIQTISKNKRNKGDYENTCEEIADVLICIEWLIERLEIDKDRYSNQLNLADKVTYVDELDGYMRTTTPKGRYNAYKMQVRNEYMIDNADVVIAVWDGTKGGTGNCVGYAKKKGKRIIQLNPQNI